MQGARGDISTLFLDARLVSVVLHNHFVAAGTFSADTSVGFTHLFEKETGLKRISRGRSNHR